MEQARSGHGQIALISGEAGTGKSRLLAECKRLAAHQFCETVSRLIMRCPTPPELETLFSAQPTVADSDPTQEKHRRFATVRCQDDCYVGESLFVATPSAVVNCAEQSEDADVVLSVILSDLHMFVTDAPVSRLPVHRFGQHWLHLPTCSCITAQNSTPR
jgi:hypothetical protein